MTDKARIKIAAIVTALFLAGISTAGLALHKHEPATAGATAPAAAAVQQPTAAPAPQVSGRGEQDGYENDVLPGARVTMTDQTPRTPPAPRRSSLGQSLLTVAAAAITSAAVIWSALFYNATNKHAAAVAAAPAPAAQAGPTSSTVAARHGARSGHHPHVMSTAIEHEHSFDLFGTRVRLLVAAPAAAPLDARIAALRVQARLTRLHHALTRFDPASELSQLNQRAGATVSVSQTMLEAIAAALHAAHVSEGLVDPTLLPQLEQAGYAHSRAGLEPADLAAAIAAAPVRRSARAHPAGVWRKIELDAAAGTVRLPAGVRLDLGGSAKGMAVDIAARMLAHSPAFAVDAGGDIRLGGTHPAPRTVRIEHPLTGETAHELVRDQRRDRHQRPAHARLAHRRGLCAPPHRPRRAATPAWTGVIQATALAPTALEAETLAKTALLLGPDHGHALLARHGGALILDDGELVLAGDLQQRAGHEPALTR